MSDSALMLFNIVIFILMTVCFYKILKYSFQYVKCKWGDAVESRVRTLSQLIMFALLILNDDNLLRVTGIVFLAIFILIRVLNIFLDLKIKKDLIKYYILSSIEINNLEHKGLGKSFKADELKKIKSEIWDKLDEYSKNSLISEMPRVLEESEKILNQENTEGKNGR